MTTIYVAGPMTGHDDFNFPAFFAAARQLRALGHEVLNPAENDGGANVDEAIVNAKASTSSWTEYMRRDLAYICAADMVCVLPGWHKSRGASLEVDTAQRLGLPVMCMAGADRAES